MNITKFSKMNIKKWEQFLSDKDTDKGYATEHLEHPDEQMKDMKLVGEAKDTQVRDIQGKIPKLGIPRPKINQLNIIPIVFKN